MLRHLLRRPTLVRLGEPPEAYQALPLRLGDLADLEALAASQTPDVVEALPPPDDPGYADALRAACDAIEVEKSTAAEWGGPLCSAVAFGTLEGRTLYLQAVLRAHGLDYDAAQALASRLTPADWARLDRIAFACDPLGELVRRVDRHIGVPEYTADGVPWPKAVCEVAESLSIAPGDMAGMTLAEFRWLRAGGEPPDPWGDWSDPFAGEFYAKEVAPRRAAFFKGGGPDSPSAEPLHNPPGDPPGSTPAPDGPTGYPPGFPPPYPGPPAPAPASPTALAPSAAAAPPTDEVETEATRS